LISVSINGQEITRLSRSLDKANRLPTRFRNEVPNEVLKWVRQRIRTRIISDKRGPDNEAWPAWADGYTGEGSLLYGKRNLVNSLRIALKSGGGSLFTNLKYAAILHYGGKAGKNKAATIPARPYMGIGQADHAPIERVINNWLQRNAPA